MPKPIKPPGKPGISSSNASVILIGAELSLEQSPRIIEQTAELSQIIKPVGIQLIMAKSHVTVYLGTVVHHINTSGNLSISVGETLNVSAAAYDVNNNVISGRPMSAVSSDPSKVRINSTSGTSEAFNISITGMAAGPSTITVTCDGVTAQMIITATSIIIPGSWLFQDSYAGGVKSGAQNGVYYTYVTDPSGPGVGSDVYITSDPGNSTGYALAFDYAASTAQGNIDQRWHMPNLTRVYVEFKIGVPLNYKHRQRLPNNNKLLRLFDNNYQKGYVHMGMSVITTPGTGETTTGKVIVEYTRSASAGGGTEDHGLGPHTIVFRQGQEVTIGYLAQVESASGAGDGIIKLWVDGIQRVDATNLHCILGNLSGDLTSANQFRNGHVFGTNNSGFSEPHTVMLLRALRIAADYPY